MRNTLGLLFAFGYTVTWAATGIGLRRLSQRLDPFLIVGIRGLVGTVIIVPLALLTGWRDFRLLTNERLIYLVGSVIIGGVFGSACSVYGLRILGVGRAFPISNASPVFSYLFSYLLLGERVRWVVVPGTLLVLAGVYFISRSRVAADQDENSPPLTSREWALGVGLAASAALLWGLNSVILAQGLEGINSIVASSVRIPVVGVMSTLIAGANRQWGSLRGLDRRMTVLLLLVGTFGYALVSTLYVAAVQYIGPGLTTLIGTTSPNFALPLSMIFLHERPTRSTLVGTILTISGILLVVT